MFLIFHLRSRQILIPVCVPQTGLPCLPPSNPNCHLESSKEYTLPEIQYKLAHRFGFVFFFLHTKLHDFKMLKKSEPKQIPSLYSPPQTRTHTWTFKPWKSDEREKERGARLPSLHIVYTYVSSSHCKHEVHWQKCLGQSLYSALNSDFCLPMQ